MKKRNLFSEIPQQFDQEIFEDILNRSDFLLERILSYGQATPEGQWYDQERDEWVVLLKGGAGMKFEDEEATIEMKPGDYLFIPAHRKHRVEWTQAQEKTVWLALHY